MSRINSVHGKVLLHDRKNQNCQMVYNGQPLHDNGSYLIVATNHSWCTVMWNGELVEVGTRHYMRIHGGRYSVKNHDYYNLEDFGKDLKVILGKIWAKVHRDNILDPEAANATVGVRG